MWRSLHNSLGPVNEKKAGIHRLLTERNLRVALKSGRRLPLPQRQHSERMETTE